MVLRFLTTYADFLSCVEELLIKQHRNDIKRFVLLDDITNECVFVPKKKKKFHEKGDPIIVLSYRGKQSVKLHRFMKKEYPSCTNK